MLSMAATAPAEPLEPPTSETCTGTVDGHAVDAATHEPVAGATVRSGDQLLGTTDEGGHFLLTGVCDGALSIIVEREDYKPGERTLTVKRHASLEIELVTSGEVIELRDKAPPPKDMRSTATIDGAALEKSRGKAFTAALAEVPGVTELRSATGVAKPIIRGQFGRRLLILVDNVRHRSQDWGLEHAPEIDPFVADQIRVVRGPGGVRYGSDAIGGVVLIDPPELRRDPGTGGEVHLIGSSNGRGGAVAGRVQSVLEAAPRLSLQLEGSARRLAAAETPNYALDNTGVFEWNAGATVGYRRKNGEYKLSYRRYDATLGVCACLRVHSVEDFLAQAEAAEPVGADEFEASFGIDRPKQRVAHDLAIARARWDLGKGTLTATYSFQQDRRREFDVVRNGDTAGAQFDFQLFTHELDTVFEHAPIHLSEHWHLRGSAGVIATGQIHNYVGLDLIPDFRGLGAGVYATERLIGHDTDLELGARYDVLSRTATLGRNNFLRLVRSDQLAMDACDAGGEAVKCGSRYHTLTTSLGVSQRLTDAWTAKAELSIASRAPNPDEQYLNGTAPTFPVLGLGKPDIKPETTYAGSATLAYEHPKLKGEASVFANYIDDYIYFAPAIGPDGMPIFDVLIRGTFPRFITRGVDAVFYGADGGVAATPHPQLELGAQASLVRARNRDDDSFLVFVPPDRYRGSITWRAPDRWRSPRKSFLTVSGTYVTKQKRFDLAADFVKPPDAYFLLGAELGTETCFGVHTARFALQGQNLTNARFRDYTSLMRYFADEPGWQVWLRMSVFFDSMKKEN
jgi:iron complex outermembrane receptor protein